MRFDPPFRALVDPSAAFEARFAKFEARFAKFEAPFVNVEAHLRKFDELVEKCDQSSGAGNPRLVAFKSGVPATTADPRQVAAQSASYMYTGDWARHFVAAVQRDGGKISMDGLNLGATPMWVRND